MTGSSAEALQGEMRTLRVGGFLTCPMDVRAIVQILRSEDDPSDDNVCFAKACSVVGTRTTLPLDGLR